ncbi:MAG: 3-deoxy-8-phosphooctulonate synthase [Verrucomicrobia bacterium]|nr:3-deoxy-8-phosphooctulonate synthase [Verrucomicrobiota bacterium]MBS0635911.1 3-deoxy-8-phosphooctulonate synthase [Verrucomicrobiota bacterium]
MNKVKIGKFLVGKDQPLTIMSGPCVIESEDHALFCAETLCEMMQKLNVNFIFKSSYDKANRSSINSFRGVGLDEGLRILEKVKTTFGVPVISDIHTPEEVPQAASVLDVLQIPAFLCRQTDMIVAAAKSQKPLHVKKGQFVAPHDMGNVVEKIVSAGNNQIILCDRGTCFGYNNLVSDMRAIPIMQRFGYPVSFDASHSVQLPGGNGTSSSGQREFIPTLAKAAIAAGVQAIFIESHPNPEKAMSDRDSVYPFKELPDLIKQLVAIYEVCV